MSRHNNNQAPPGLQGTATLSEPALWDDIIGSELEPAASEVTQPSAGKDLLHSAAGTPEVGRGYRCLECGDVFHTKTALDRHGSYNHQPFACTCGIKFARSDILSRHLKTENGEAEHQCPLCKRRRDTTAFTRLDHLTQHLVGFHKCDPEQIAALVNNTSSRPCSTFLFVPACPSPDCDKYRGEHFFLLPDEVQEQTRPFAKNADYYRHMRSSHNLSHFPCAVLGCDKVGGKGYFREKDLINHHRLKHSDTPLQVQVWLSPKFLL
ncbi:hypothetical protein G7Z17_g219 [Cylindrodendrum hubeiense]|uniref:C2H2-type domain-containing protein n=1 Tax=Cylindrodendrum hubeiense TaxID=595255 RepID=A0A9P5HH36_9HYPO|nr:hypothetical protein G7Z17_g219 [Cylindrodendrum hubeiense]